VTTLNEQEFAALDAQGYSGTLNEMEYAWLLDQCGGGPSPPASAFDAAIVALSPDYFYKIDDSTFATSLLDSGSEAQDLLTQNATPGSNGTAMRSTKTKSLEMPAWTTGNWAANAAHYAEAGSTLAALLDISDACTVVMSINAPFQDLNTSQDLLSVASNPIVGVTSCFYLQILDVGEILRCHEEHTTGSSVTETPSNINDGVTHLIIWRTGPEKNLELDGTEVDLVEVPQQSFITLAVPLQLGATSDNGQAYRTDCIAVWDSYLSNVNIADLWTLYTAETP
jgi:hypothetical protein